MSYYSRVCCSLSNDVISEDIPFHQVEPVAKSWLIEHDISLDVLEDIAESMETDFFDVVGFNNMYAPDIIDLYQYISTQFPKAELRVRGVGEEFHDMWYRHFKNGEEIKAMR